MIKEINDLSLPELEPYRITAERQLVRYFEPELGIFIAESPNVIRRALESGYSPISLLLERKFVKKIPDIIEGCGDVPVFTAPLEVLTSITGFELTQGALCAMRRKEIAYIESVLKNAKRVAVLEDIMNQTNVGAIFRSAAALGIDGVLLTKGCSDPLYRRCVRVSMGTVFQIPYSRFEDDGYMPLLKKYGFATASMALRNDTVPIDDERLIKEERLAIILGTEGTGLKEETIAQSDYTIKIPMHNGVDSLNVAAASAVAFWQLGKK